MFGAIYGDVIGSYYEVHCTKDYNFEFNKEDSCFTDDSVLIAAVCKAILKNPTEISMWNLRARAKEYAAQYRQYYSYHPHAGFGNMFAAWAKNPPAYPAQSQNPVPAPVRAGGIRRSHRSDTRPPRQRASRPPSR